MTGIILHVLDLVSDQWWAGWDVLEDWDRTGRQL